MSSLTAVVVTQSGREKFLPYLIESLQQTLDRFDSFRVVFVLNGVAESSSSLVAINSLHSLYPQNTSIISFYQNSPFHSRIWVALRSLELDWVFFPGDDDVVIPDGVHEFFKMDKLDEIEAVSFNSRLIDSLGNNLGRSLKPSIRNTEFASIGSVLESFHQPPFIWPSLLFRISSLPEQVFQSRYVFDWCVSLHLVLSGKYLYMDEDLVRYRVHDAQESNLVPDSRKRLEAMLMISHFLDTTNTLERIREGVTVEDLLGILEQKPPIYGDELFGGFVLWRIYSSAIHGEVTVPNENAHRFSNWIRQFGVYLSNSELPHMPGMVFDLKPSSYNINMELHRSCCSDVFESFSTVFTSSLPPAGIIYCNHVSEPQNTEAIFFDCRSVKNAILFSKDIDMLLSAASLKPTSIGTRLSLSSFESNLILNFRKIKVFLRRYHLFRKI